MRRLNWFIVVATFAASSIYAQDISGDWQGSLKAGPQDLRIILKTVGTVFRRDFLSPQVRQTHRKLVADFIVHLLQQR